MLIPGRVADKRAAFGHAVADGHAEFDQFEKLFDFLIQRRAADHNLRKITAERIG